MRAAFFGLIFLVILLVVSFRFPELRVWFQGCHDFLWPDLVFFRGLDSLLGDLFLRVVVIKNGRAVLRSDIDALPVFLGGVVGPPGK